MKEIRGGREAWKRSREGYVKKLERVAWGEDNEKEIRKTGKDTQKEFTGEKDTRQGVGNK